MVDEEHRFGVVHKERIKRLSTHIDVLFLTATPIPRSLYMSLVGLRDFSLIETPPEGRMPIRTVVTPFSEETIRQAIRQELARGGQVFFVHNRIDTLPAMERLLTRLVPECRIGVAHGQMREAALERTMLRFLRREFDLLLCTTLIESGLDIPSVNTILIDRADQFGLAQLYQLRGRVGRGTQQAYAYLLVPADTLLSPTARKRIEALEEFRELGSGFHLATRDLEIRGAGNLLGPQQSGHIASVGFDLYCQMLADAIRAARGEPLPVRIEPELHLPVQGALPETYVAEEGQRLAFYRRLATATSFEALEEVRSELADRFGPPPAAAQRLLHVVELKLLARELGIERLECRAREARLTFHPQSPVTLEQLFEWLRYPQTPCRFLAERTIALPLPETSSLETLLTLKNRLQQLRRSVSM
ncbi:MAG: hypothetical protein KatS3mg131_0815 [Candidatus Tectimicrobiota bacterium]|nr:MAG: hypothetical protein KatS3mg131_0815 [Candidatus Tectomicrobia bacterium]